jgi:hypothetical protein
MRKIIYPILLIALISSCKKISTSFDREAFYAMKNKWQNSNISNYSFKYRNGGLANFSNTYVIKNNVIVKIIPDTLSHVDTSHRYTISTLFDKIEDLYNHPYIIKNNSRTYCYYNQINTSFDPQYGFPNSCFCDYECKNIAVTDLGWGFSITNFEILNE